MAWKTPFVGAEDTACVLSAHQAPFLKRRKKKKKPFYIQNKITVTLITFKENIITSAKMPESDHFLKNNVMHMPLSKSLLLFCIQW